MNKDDQQVLVVPSVAFIHGQHTSAKKFKELVNNEGKYLRRGDMEVNLNYRQVIPYVLIAHDEKEPILFRYKRGKSGGEARLHGLWSLGIGGHVEQGQDKPTLYEEVLDAAYREIAEEVHISLPVGSDFPAMQPIGVVALNDTPVDSVHVGLVFALFVQEPFVTGKENCISCTGWVEPQEVTSFASNYEKWSSRSLGLFLDLVKF